MTTNLSDNTASLPRTIALPLRELVLFGFLATAAFAALALGSYTPTDPGFSGLVPGAEVANWIGVSGAWFADLSYYVAGRVALFIPGLLTLLGIWSFRHVGRPLSGWLLGLRCFGTLAVVLASCTLAQMHWSATGLPAGAGGIIGRLMVDEGLPVFGAVGLTLLSVTVLLMGLQAALSLSWLALAEALGRAVYGLIDRFLSWLDRKRDALRAHREAREQRVALLAERAEARREPITSVPEILNLGGPKTSVAVRDSVAPPVPKATAVKRKPQRSLFPATEAGLGDIPALDLLDESPAPSERGYSRESLEAMSRLLELKLADFNIEAEVVSVQPGPVVTRFELQPAAGVKVQRITALAKDLARSLAVISVRIVEIIPGKSVIGIEIPNEQREMVRLKEVLASAEFQDKPAPLSLALGSDIAGVPVVADIAKMPHLLVAGTTGSGKSVGINAMLLSLLYKASPEEVRLILVDPKMLELSVYEGIPHLLTPVVTDMKDAAQALNWCVGEMERRYKLMAGVGVRNLAGYNRAIAKHAESGDPLTDPNWPEGCDIPAPELERLPMIVVVIDEFADMMMIVGKKVEQLIARIAQKARAAGIHLVLATQRPSVDVITGLIKANIPTRISFQVSSKIDSRTILDQGGAEQLLGHGDMLYLPPGTAVPTRVHGAFVSDDEVHRVVEDWKQRGAPEYLEEVLHGAAEDVPGVLDLDESSANDADDTLYDEAVAFVLESRRASISAVQRKLRIGYNRAARLIETMEAQGVVSTMNTNGSREVLVPKREH
ncbi:MAG: DNA translocase FtsK 4TM domain-containing protein [Pseudomonadota bacterium]